MERALEFLRAAEESVCDRVRPATHGMELSTPSLPLVWDLNKLRVEDGSAAPAGLDAEAEALQGSLGHRKLVVREERLGARLAPGLAELGWRTTRLLAMARRRPSRREVEPGLGVEADHELGATALAAFRCEQALGAEREAVRQLAAMDDRCTGALGARDFVAPPRRPASVCRLYSRGRIAQIDEVGTLAGHRRRGLASAAVLAAADAARAAGGELVFLLTDAGDFPKVLYAQLGFEEIGCIYEFLKLPIASGSR